MSLQQEKQEIASQSSYSQVDEHLQDPHSQCPASPGSAQSDTPSPTQKTPRSFRLYQNQPKIPPHFYDASNPPFMNFAQPETQNIEEIPPTEHTHPHHERETSFGNVQAKLIQGLEQGANKFYGDSINSGNTQAKSLNRNNFPTFGEEDFHSSNLHTQLDTPKEYQQSAPLGQVFEQISEEGSPTSQGYSRKAASSDTPQHLTKSNAGSDSGVVPNDSESHSVFVPAKANNIKPIQTSNSLQALQGYMTAPAQTPKRIYSQYTVNSDDLPTPGAKFQVYSTTTAASNTASPTVKKLPLSRGSPKARQGSEAQQAGESQLQSEKGSSSSIVKFSVGGVESVKMSQDMLSTKQRSPKNIPKISENSYTIYKNSQRAREDEQIIHDLLTAKAKKLLATELGQSSIKLQKIPEELEEPKVANPPHNKAYLASHILEKLHQQRAEASPKRSTDSRSPKKSPSSINSSPKNSRYTPKSPLTAGSPKGTPVSQGPKQVELQINIQTDEIRVKPYYTAAEQAASMLMAEKLIKTDPDSPHKRSQRSTHVPQTPEKLSPKRSTLRSTIEPANEFDFNALVQAITAPPLNASGLTTIEHKRQNPAGKPGQKDVPQTAEAIRSLSPKAKEKLREMATLTKQIYLKVVDNRSKNLSPKAAAKQAEDEKATSEILRELMKRAEPYWLSPEEISQYDEVQRLDVILHNLKQIQNSNLLALLNLKAPNVSTSRNVQEAQAPPSQPRKSYANKVNDSAMELRKKKEAERLRGLVPQPPVSGKMPRVEKTLDAFTTSLQMRQEDGPWQEIDPLTSPTMMMMDSQQMRSWAELGFYERNMLWLDAKNDKMDKYNSNKSCEEMKGCTFKPQLCTMKQSNSVMVSTEKYYGGVDQPKEPKSGVEKVKSLYREKKVTASYNGLFDLKKNYNQVKEELFNPPSGMRMDRRTSKFQQGSGEEIAWFAST